MEYLPWLQILSYIQPIGYFEVSKVVERDYNQIIGHTFAKRALEIVVSGEHYVLMDGSLGFGKSLLAETFSSILVPISKEAQLEKISLYQLEGDHTIHFPYCSK